MKSTGNHDQQLVGELHRLRARVSDLEKLVSVIRLREK